VEWREGHIHFRSRAKDILVLSNGEKLPPTDVENVIAADPTFEQVMLIGEGRPFLALLAVTDETDEQALVKRANAMLTSFARYVRVRRVIPLRERWTVDTGLLTPTLKLKRGAVEERFREQIDQVYSSERE
jgi:long-chain acyl-CoA synthetase